MRTDLHRVHDDEDQADYLRRWQDDQLGWIEEAGDRLVVWTVYAAFAFVLIGLALGWFA